MSTQQIVLLTTNRMKELKGFTEALKADEHVTVIPASTAEEAIETAVRVAPVLAIIDQLVGVVEGLDIIRRLLRVNAFIHTAILSDMDEETFHERGEGLGILTRLPIQPSGQDANKLLALLRSLAPLE